MLRGCQLDSSFCGLHIICIIFVVIIKWSEVAEFCALPQKKNTGYVVRIPLGFILVPGSEAIRARAGGRILKCNAGRTLF